MVIENAIRRRVRDPNKPRTARQQERRDRILAETQRLIVTKGYRSVTMDQLAEASGVTKKTLYDIYGSKDALLAACVDQRVSQVFGRIRREVSGRGIDRLLAVTARTAEASIEGAALQRALEPVLLSHLSQFSVIRVFQGLHRECLEEIRDDGDWLASADLSFIARNLMVDHIALENWWAAGIIDDGQLRSFSLLNACRILLPVTVGQTRLKIESAIASLQDELKDWRYGIIEPETGCG